MMATTTTRNLIIKLSLPVLFLAVIAINKIVNQPYMSIFAGPFLITAFLIIMYWNVYYIGHVSLSVFYKDQVPEHLSWPIKIFVGFMVVVIYLLVLGVTYSLNMYMILIPLTIFLYFSYDKLTGEYSNLKAYFKTLNAKNIFEISVIISSMLLFVGLFATNIFKTEFQQDSLDVYNHYITNIVYYLKTQSIKRMYFPAEFKIDPFLYSSLIYTFILSLTNVHTLSFFFAGQIILSGLICFYFCRNFLKIKYAIIAPIAFFLSFKIFYLMDMGINFLKFPHMFTLSFTLLPVYFVYIYTQRKDNVSLILLAVSSGFLVGDFSPGWISIVPAVTACTLWIIYSDKSLINRKAKSAIFVCSVAAVSSIPFIVNYYYCHVPFDGALVKPMHNLSFSFNPYPEFYDKFIDYINIEYWKDDAIKTALPLMLDRIGGRFFLLFFVFINFIFYFFIKANVRSDHKYFFNISFFVFAMYILLPTYYHKFRLQTFILPVLSVMFVVYLANLDNLAKAFLSSLPVYNKIFKNLVFGIIFITVCFLASYSNYFPSLGAIKNSLCSSTKWVFNGYESHHKYANHFYESDIYKYIDLHVAEDEKIILNKPNHLIYTLHRISLSFHSHPFYYIFNRNEEELFDNLQKLKIRYMFLFDNTDFIAPYRPLLLKEEFALKHLKLVVSDELTTYLQNSEYFLMNDEDIPEPFEKSYNAYLFEISPDEVIQNSQTSSIIKELIGRMKIKNIYSEEIVREIEKLSLDSVLVARIRSYDRLLTN